MKLEVDFNAIIKTPRGKDMMMGEEEEERPFLLGDVFSSLMGSWAEDKRDGQQKNADTRLALKMQEGEAYKSLSLNDKQRKHLKDVAFATVPGAHIYTQICDLLGFGEDEEVEEDDK